LTSTERISRLLRRSSEVVVADLQGEPLSSRAMTEAVVILKAAYGREYSPEKLTLLFSMCLDEEWTSKRFMDTLKWVVKNNPYPEWKPADFFKAPLVKLHGYEWACEQWAKKLKLKQYKIGDRILFALADEEIPLPEYIPPPVAFVAPEAPTVTNEEREQILARVTSEPAKRGSVGSYLGDLAKEIE
jgi:hypothetical protein